VTTLSLACTDTFEIPIETPISPKLDISSFQRVLVAGFVAGGSEELDANQETVRLLRSQLRSKSPLKVIDAAIMPLIEIAYDQTEGASRNVSDSTNGGGPTSLLPKSIREERDLQPFERIFANTAYWKKLGEEYQNPLIVTGTVLFKPQSSTGFVQREEEIFDPAGRRRIVPIRTYTERRGFVLRPKFIFIDGRTGATMYSETYREEILYNNQQSAPALSSYFELMDRLVPNFLNALSVQKIRGSRLLFK
jgi:hypothetical protein